MFAHPKILFAVSAFLLAGLPARAATESGEVAPVTLPTAIVKCPGVSGIPFTADPEQALPLRVVGTLTCGSTVAILEDGEGYTAQIRTADGQEGYVARMYLLTGTAAPAAAATAKPQPSVATPLNGVVRWQAGAPGCSEFVSHGNFVESITANGITVQVSLQDTGWKYRANVAVVNQGAAAATVQPGIITLDELQPRLRTLFATNIDKISGTSTHRVLWTMAGATPSPSAAFQSGMNSGTASLADRTPAPPDYLSPHLALTSAPPGLFARSASVDLEAIALKPVILASQEKTAGVMWFKRDADARELSLRVPAGDLVFDFSFSFEQKR